MAKKKVKKVKKVFNPIKVPAVHVCCQDEPIVKTRLQELQELYEVLKRENIASISKLEAMISQLQSEA